MTLRLAVHEPSGGLSLRDGLVMICNGLLRTPTRIVLVFQVLDFPNCEKGKG